MDEPEPFDAGARARARTGARSAASGVRSPTPCRSGSATAYWPQRRNSAQPAQSCAIFSGSQACGTIEKPRCTKCDGSCVKAHRVANPARARAVGHRGHERRAGASPAAGCVDDQRANLRHVFAERRELRAADDVAPGGGNDEPGGVRVDVFAPTLRQQDVPPAGWPRSSPRIAVRVRGRAGPQFDGHARGPSVEAHRALEPRSTASSMSAVGDDERRQQPDDGIRRAVDQQPLARTRAAPRPPPTGELDAPHQSGAANFRHGARVRGRQLAEPRFEMGTGVAHVLRSPSAGQLVQKHERRAARQQVAAVRAAVIPGARRRRDLVGEQRRADWDAGAERLAERHEIRTQAHRRRSQEGAGPSRSRLHLVGDEQRAGPRARARHRRGGAVADRPHAPLALDGLDDDRGGVRADRGLDRVGIVRRHERDARHERRERRAIVLVPRHRQRAGGPPVEAVLERDNPRSAAFPAPPSTGARTSGTPPPLPHRCCRRTPAAVRRAPRGAPRAPPAADGDTDSTCGAGVPPDRRLPRESRVAMSERRDADAGDEVEVALAAGRRQAAAGAAREHERRAPIHLQDVRGVERDGIGERGGQHVNSRARPIVVPAASA